jgi:hypothetical protein
MRQLVSAADLLQARPGFVLELDAHTSEADRRRLAEQALLGQLEPSGGFQGFLRALGVPDARDRIRTALTARARGAPGPLDRADEARLTEMLAQGPPVDDAQLDALREARLARVVDRLAGEYGIAADRIIVRPAAEADGTGRPAVRVRARLDPKPSRAKPAPVAAESATDARRSAPNLEGVPSTGRRDSVP